MSLSNKRHQKQKASGDSLFEFIKEGDTKRAKELKEEMEMGSKQHAGSPGGRRADLAYIQQQANKAFNKIGEVLQEQMSGWTQVFNINVDRDDQVTSDTKVDQVKKTARNASDTVTQ